MWISILDIYTLGWHWANRCYGWSHTSQFNHDAELILLCMLFFILSDSDKPVSCMFSWLLLLLFRVFSMFYFLRPVILDVAHRPGIHIFFSPSEWNVFFHTFLSSLIYVYKNEWHHLTLTKWSQNVPRAFSAILHRRHLNVESAHLWSSCGAIND